MRAIKKIFNRKIRAGSSGAEVLLFGMMMIWLMFVFIFIQTVYNGYSAKFSMIDGNLTSSLLSVALADKKRLSETGVVSLANTTTGSGSPAIMAYNSRLSSIPDSQLITNLFDSIKTNFEDSDSSDDSSFIITNDTLFGEGGKAKLIAVQVINKEVYEEETLKGIMQPAYMKYNLRSTEYIMSSVDSILRYDYDYKTGGYYKEANDWEASRAAGTSVKKGSDNILKTKLRSYESGRHEGGASLKESEKTNTGEDITECTVAATLKIDFGPGFW